MPTSERAFVSHLVESIVWKAEETVDQLSKSYYSNPGLVCIKSLIAEGIITEISLKFWRT